MTLGNRASPHERAQVIFIAISVVCLGYVMMAGIFQTADSISEEKREGTLGLLFLTDLKGYDVVLGKLASSSLHSFYTFLAVVPVMALPLLMGGMTVDEFWRVTLVLVVTSSCTIPWFSAR
jgi:ABC-type transport system involved in multi-copper enzyme maturation permease subunit